MPVTREQIEDARRRRQTEDIGFVSPPRVGGAPTGPTELFPALPEPDVLFEQLKGKTVEEAARPGWLGGEAVFDKDFAANQARRRIATGLLKKRGFSQADINSILEIKRQITPSARKEITHEAAKGIGGGIGAAVAVGAGQFGPLAALPEELVTAPALGAVGAFAGGLLAEAGYRGVTEGRLATPEELLGAGREEAVFEVGGRLGLSALKGGLKYTPLVKKPHKETARLVAEYGELAHVFSPAELDDRILVHASEAVSRGAFGTKQLWDELPGRIDDAVNLIGKHLRESIVRDVATGSPDEIGRVLREAIVDKEGWIVKRLDDYFEPLYRKVDDLTQFRYEPIFEEMREVNVYKTISGSKRGLTEKDIMPLGGRWVDKITGQDVIIDPEASGSAIRKFIGKKVVGTGVKTDALKAIARQELEIHGRMMKVGKEEAGLYLSSTGESLLRDILKLENEIGFGDMWKLKTRFQIEARKLHREVDASHTLVKRLSSAALDSMDDSELVKNLPDEAKNLIQNTNRLYKSAANDLKVHFPESLAKKLLEKPAAVIKEVFPQDNPALIADFKRSLIHPIEGQTDIRGRVLWDQLRQAWVADLLEESMTASSLRYTQYYNRMKKMGGSLSTMFSPDELKTLNDIGKVLEISKVGSPAGTGLFTKGIQIGGAMTLWRGHQSGSKVVVVKGGALMLGPWAYAKLALSKKHSGLLTVGMTLRPGSKQFVAHAVRLTNALKEIETEEMNLMQKQRDVEQWRKAQTTVREGFWYARP